MRLSSVKYYAHCVAYDIWRTRTSKTHFSLSITVPLWIMHMDMWSPGHVSDDQGQKWYLMSSICDISQFVISSPTTDITSVHLCQLFMSDVILVLEMCLVAVIDDGSLFKNVFMNMCTSLDITYWYLSRGNHKGNLVEHYHWFLNMTQAIVGNNRGTHKFYLQNAKMSQYAWNSAPIDDM